MAFSGLATAMQRDACFQSLRIILVVDLFCLRLRLPNIALIFTVMRRQISLKAMTLTCVVSRCQFSLKAITLTGVVH